jgi:hypothetical protein
VGWAFVKPINQTTLNAAHERSLKNAAQRFAALVIVIEMFPLCSQVLTNYLVDCENLSPRQALEQFESSVALAFGSFTTDEQQEMAWKQEFGFDDEDEETVDDHGCSRLCSSCFFLHALYL